MFWNIGTGIITNVKVKMKLSRKSNSHKAQTCLPRIKQKRKRGETNNDLTVRYINTEEMQDGNRLKASMFLKNKHFIIREMFNKLIYDINTTIKWGT